MRHHITPEQIVVIGAGLAGLRAAEQLRLQGYRGGITMVGRETAEPSGRPPLPGQVLAAAWEEEQSRVATGEALAALDIDFRPGVAASGLDIWKVHLEDGTVLHADATIVASGAQPRLLPGQPAGVGTLHTLAEADSLRERLGEISTLLIVGGGFTATRAATAARAAGVAVTVLESRDQPCLRALGGSGAGLVARLYRDAGVELRTGTEAAGFIDPSTVELAGGEKVQAEHVLVTIGSEPDAAWAAGAGLPLREGILAGGTGRVPPLPEVWALGDAAAWWDQPRRGYARTGHWSAVNDQAAMVAADILGLDTPALAPPYLWSEAFGTTVELLGRTDIADEVVQLHGSGLDGGPVPGTVLGHRREGHLVAVVAFGDGAAVERYRADVAAGTRAITTVAEEIED